MDLRFVKNDGKTGSLRAAAQTPKMAATVRAKSQWKDDSQLSKIATYFYK